jgi:rare lipoprotein A
MPSSNKAAAAALLLTGCSVGSELPSPARADVVAPDRLAAVPLPPEAEGTSGPAGTSGAGDARYDSVGEASRYGEGPGHPKTASGTPFDPDAITAAHRILPLGSHAEVTALDTGRTILVLINDRGPTGVDREIELSRGAATLLGLNGPAVAAVRVRAVVASTADAAALASGRPASRRLDAPPALIAALRGQMPPQRTVAFVQSGSPRQPSQGARGYLVQVAAFSSSLSAQRLAAMLGGHVEPAGPMYRVRLGPFGDAAAAQRARDGAARRGYGDASIIVQPRKPE